jgi:DNA-binding MarR family transcriptional regulator
MRYKWQFREGEADRAMTKRRKMSKRDYEALGAFRYALRRFLHFSEERAAEVGLKPQQHQALLAIMGMPGRKEATVGEIAERLQIAHHSAVGLLQRLEAGGLVSRRQDDDDKRQVFVGLTPQGLALLEQLSLAHLDELSRIRPELMRVIEEIDAAE